MWYGLAAPLAVIALPLATLLLLATPRTLRGRLVAGIAGGFAVWWLLGPGDLPDQTLRAAALMTTVTFALLSRRTAWSFTHRARAALAAATAGTAACFLAFGWSWGRLHWWTAFRTGPALRLMLGSAAAGSSDGGAVPFGSGPRAFEQLIDQLVTTSADLYPSAIALQLFAGLAIAAVLARRLAGEAAGVPPGPLAEFRFSEHLGWPLVLAVASLLIPALSGARTMALNVLVVIGALYGLRGLAVIVYGIRALKGGPLLYAAAALAVFFVLPGVVLLGVLDAGLNLRRRWLPPRGA
jgi:hypothetical protein